MMRMVAAARMQAQHRWWSFGYPMLIPVLAFISVPTTTSSDTSGSSDGVLVGMIVVVPALIQFVGATQFLPFLVGLGVTRRDFLGGALLVALLQMGAVGAAMLLLAALERVTGGWGIGIRNFRGQVWESENIAVQWLAFVAPLLAFAACGILVGAVFLRWGRIGIVVFSIGVGMVLGVVLAVLIGLSSGPPGLSGALPVPVQTILLPLLGAAVVAASGYLVLRRTAL